MEIKKIGILRQSTAFGSWWGNIQNVATHMNIFIQFSILGFSSIAAYGVFSDGLRERGYNIPFWLFALAGTTALVTLALFVWKFTMHSMFAAWNQQWWEHNNPLRTEVKEIKKELAEIKKLIKETK
jgi:hypothetical protein